MSFKRLPLFTLFLGFGCIACLASAPSWAQYDPNADKPLEEDKGPGLNLVDRGLYTLQLLRVPGGKPGDFTIRATNPGTVSGCVTLTDPDIKVKFLMNKVDVTLEADQTFELKDDEPRYGAYSCDTETHTSYFDVTLNRDELIDHNSKFIGLKSKEFGMYSSDKIDVSQEKIELLTQYPWGSELITFWFYPANTVILHAPAAKSGHDVSALIDGFAESKGLVPLSKTLKGHELPYWATNMKYYTDPRGAILNQLSTPGENAKVGSVTAHRTVYGSDGAGDQPYALDILGRTPGTTD
ncbi:MAG: hypothetical protein IPH06_01655 [Alphaproteobacteria bacterium]|jgi:hypothetical protein|nr:hypothetical protein [Alphaproteobacteria bacterium]QQS56761.1 MAG: hypothetical protein IPN28_10910 [Alphaproteobacteria bacterium]